MILIKSGKIFTMSGDMLENGSVLIENGKIVEVGSIIHEPSGAQVIDAGGGWVLPGFIDAHCHIGMMEESIGFEGRDVNEATDPVTPHLRAIDGINPMDEAFDDAVKAGITTVMTGPGSANPVGGQFAVIKTKGRSIDDMVLMQPAAVKIAFGENPKTVYNKKSKMPMTRMGTAAIIRETIVNAINYKNKKEKALSTGEYFNIDLKMEAMLPVINKEIPLKAHAHRADDILTALRIAKEFNLLITLDHCTEGSLIVDYIKESKAPAILGPMLSSKSKIELKNKSFSTPGKLSRSGVKIALMTDHPVIPIQYLPICAGLAVKEGLEFSEALKSITIYAAEIAGVSDRVGSIEKGKDADIVIYNGNPLEVFSSNLCTIIDGKIVFQNFDKKIQ